jgi:hypothetical protein
MPDEASYFVFMHHPDWDKLSVHQATTKDGVASLLAQKYQELGRELMEEIEVTVVHGVPVDVQFNMNGLVVSIEGERLLAGVPPEES